MMRIKGIQYRLYHKGALCDACVCTKAIMATKATNIYKCESDKLTNASLKFRLDDNYTLNITPAVL